MAAIHEADDSTSHSESDSFEGFSDAEVNRAIQKSREAFEDLSSDGELSIIATDTEESEAEESGDDIDWDLVDEPEVSDVNNNNRSAVKFGELPGPQHVPRTAAKPSDFFFLLFSWRLMDMVCGETNRYAKQQKEAYDNQVGADPSKRSKTFERTWRWWTDSGCMTFARLKAFLGKHNYFNRFIFLDCK